MPISTPVVTYDAVPNGVSGKRLVDGDNSVIEVVGNEVKVNVAIPAPSNREVIEVTASGDVHVTKDALIVATGSDFIQITIVNDNDSAIALDIKNFVTNGLNVVATGKTFDDQPNLPISAVNSSARIVLNAPRAIWNVIS